MKDYSKPNIDPRRRPAIFNKGVKSDDSVGGIIYLAKVILTLFIFGLVMVVQSVQYTRLEDQVRELSLQKRALENELMPLEIAELRLINLGDVENLARSKLKMIFPKPESTTKIIVKQK